VKPSCDKCGACCRQLIVEAYDLDVLREPHLAAADIGERTREMVYQDLMAELEQDGACLVIAGGGESCKFLRESGTCAIYATRPNVCVALQPGDDQCGQARQAEGLPPLECR
jgi:Fe-S-cluster containining protein